jgi:hypothetical protein
MSHTHNEYLFTKLNQSIDEIQDKEFSQEHGYQKKNNSPRKWEEKDCKKSCFKIIEGKRYLTSVISGKYKKYLVTLNESGNRVVIGDNHKYDTIDFINFLNKRKSSIEFIYEESRGSKGGILKGTSRRLVWKN